MKTEIELDEALERLVALAKEDDDRMAVQFVKQAVAGMRLEVADFKRQAETYRHLYEGIQKTLMRYRDIAGRPDIPENIMADRQDSNELTETQEKENN